MNTVQLALIVLEVSQSRRDWKLLGIIRLHAEQKYLDALFNKCGVLKQGTRTNNVAEPEKT
jgi:hypothetical protein